MKSDTKSIAPLSLLEAAVVREGQTTAPATARARPSQLLSVCPRLDSVDLLRGLVMVIMALDHVRDFFAGGIALFAPTDLSETNAALFVTRWVTHFCAPVFVFLAGTGAFLSASRGKTRTEIARFLLTRGLWLVFVELTIVRCFGWAFNFDYHYFSVGVIWTIGWSMVVLAGLVFFPTRAVAVFGLSIIAAHNLFDGVQADEMGAFRWLWIILHSPGRVEPLPGVYLGVVYTLIPWVGVMATGYAFGALLLAEESRRRKWLLGLGVALSLAFVAIRATNFYGDPEPWSAQKNALFTFFSFINCRKYPASLLFLLMTLGPAILALALLKQKTGPLSRFLVIFGRVPLFYYVMHLTLIHAAAVGFAYARYGQARWLFEGRRNMPEDYGYSLPVIYLVWLTVVLILFPACRWFAGVKQRRRDKWLSYL